jgi:hypothetical protein
MELGTLLILLLVLACPLMMVFMHRGGHGGQASHGEGHGHTHGVADEVSDTGSLDELRSRRAELDGAIAQLEQSETETKTPAVV